MRTLARAAALFGWVVALTATAVGLAAVGAGHLAMPPVLQPAEWAPWALEREPVDVVAGVGRLGGIAVSLVLLASTLAQLLVALRRPNPRDGEAARRRLPLTPAFVAALVTAVASTSHAGAQVTAVPPGAGAILEVVEDSGAGARTSLPLAPDEPSTPAPSPGQPEPPAPPTTVAAAPTTSETAASKEWVVAPGDHLWGIAEHVLTERTGADPTDRDVHRYWVQLIRVNTDRLVDPDDPDLILPGQRLALP